MLLAAFTSTLLQQKTQLGLTKQHAMDDIVSCSTVPTVVQSSVTTWSSAFLLPHGTDGTQAGDVVSCCNLDL